MSDKALVLEHVGAEGQVEVHKSGANPTVQLPSP
jgi:hypothetical protein